MPKITLEVSKLPDAEDSGYSAGFQQPFSYLAR